MIQLFLGYRGLLGLRLFLANVNSRLLYAVARPSLCRLSVCLSVTLVHPTEPVEIFSNVSTPFGTLAEIHGKFYGDCPMGTPPPEELNTRGVAKYSDSDLSKAISRKWCKIGCKLVIITNRKSCMSFRLVPKSVSSNDLEWRNGPYYGRPM